MLISHQIRAARGLLGWSADELAGRAGVEPSAVRRMEGCNRAVRGSFPPLKKVKRALEKEGVEFLDESGAFGVRVTKHH